MASRRGTSSTRITVSEVSNGTPASATSGGMLGRDPAAMTIRSPLTVTVPEPSVRSMPSSRSPVKRACPKYTVTLGLRSTR